MSISLPEVDWEHVFKRLLVRARFLTYGLPELLDSTDASDLVGETLVSFFDSATALGWDPRFGSLEAFLAGVLKNKFRDHLRSSRRFVTDAAEVLERSAKQEPEQAAKEALDAFMIYAKGDKELEELIEVLPQVDDSKHNVNQQLAELLHVTPTEVVNRKRRFSRRLKR